MSNLKDKRYFNFSLSAYLFERRVSMKCKSLKLILALSLVACIPLIAAAQEEGYKFTIDKELARTSVKQQVGSTCWCYATISMLEAEVLRTQQKDLNLAERYLVAKIIPEKASNYVRLGGKTNVAEGGLVHHVTEPWRKFGLVPEEIYPHISLRPLFGELRTMMDEQVKTRAGYTPDFNTQVEALIEKHLGKVPEKFTYQDKEYTPQTFAAQVVQLNPDDYIELTSYTHHPFYTQIRLEIPDNWDFEDDFYNIPLDEYEQIVDYSINNGYTVTWDGDTGRRGKVNAPDCYLVPVDEPQGEKVPAKEKVITQELRQKSFDTFDTTDVHLMHITGIAHDQNGEKFYLIKNSHGTRGAYDGYKYMSRSFFRLDTISIGVNRNAIPQELRQKMGIRTRRIRE
jgi:bleomycin hydrolase